MRLSSVTSFAPELVVTIDISALRVLTALPAAPTRILTALAIPALPLLDFLRREPCNRIHDGRNFCVRISDYQRQMFVAWSQMFLH